MGMVKELLQQKEVIANGAQLLGNRPGLALHMPDGLKEFNIHLVPGATPVGQGMRRFTAEET
jgi:hypothetical protein